MDQVRFHDPTHPHDQFLLPWTKLQFTGKTTTDYRLRQCWWYHKIVKLSSLLTSYDESWFLPFLLRDNVHSIVTFQFSHVQPHWWERQKQATLCPVLCSKKFSLCIFVVGVPWLIGEECGAECCLTRAHEGVFSHFTVQKWFEHTQPPCSVPIPAVICIRLLPLLFLLKAFSWVCLCSAGVLSGSIVFILFFPSVESLWAWRKGNSSGRAPIQLKWEGENSIIVVKLCLHASLIHMPCTIHICNRLFMQSLPCESWVKVYVHASQFRIFIWALLFVVYGSSAWPGCKCQARKETARAAGCYWEDEWGSRRATTAGHQGRYRRCFNKGESLTERQGKFYWNMSCTFMLFLYASNWTTVSIVVYCM